MVLRNEDEFLEWCRKLVRDPGWRGRVEIGFRERTLPSWLEQMVVHYAIGKPAEQVNLKVEELPEDLSSLTDEQLAERAALISKELRTKERGRMN